ncbi:helix-turn-helix domain-containing protein [Sphingomonas sp. So64.6b]|uniref:IclR family transcriptional regulator n=1 Tax=Sphingomonas sp. So64.6b TaxID=2997354 RepID=UPI001601ADA8|nr:helix-turn-helix domain-containing protein [Sphingomonas sp. So64.6b]QNA85512.1 helix-turn-helix domain-containing protein [Sphingomonas sp. So64.6b]
MNDRDPRRQAPSTAAPTIEVVATTSAIIDFLAESAAPVGVQQVATVLGLTKSRASRHLANLERLGIVTRSNRGRRFQLGWRVIRWGHLASALPDLPEALGEPLAALRDKLGLTVLICTAAGGDAVVRRCFAARSAIRIEVETGLMLSLPHSPSARVAFAFQSRERRRELLAHLKSREASFRVEDADNFTEQVAAIQRDYYSWTLDKFDLGHGAAAAPVFDFEEALACVVTIMLTSDALTDRAPPRHVIEALLDCCEQCSRLLRSRIRFPVPQ